RYRGGGALRTPGRARDALDDPCAGRRDLGPGGASGACRRHRWGGKQIMRGQPQRAEGAGDLHGLPAPAEMSFEQALARLEEIVARIETGDAGLEESLRLLDEGVAPARCSRAQPGRAEACVPGVAAGLDGELLERDFMTGDTGAGEPRDDSEDEDL